MTLSECLYILESGTAQEEHASYPGQEERHLAALDCSQLTEKTGQGPNPTPPNPEAQDLCSRDPSSQNPQKI